MFDILEAATGAYVASFDMGLQNFILGVDPETGAKTIDESLIPGGGRTDAITVCPHGGGGRNWPATSLNPDTRMLYVPAVDLCMDMIPPDQGVPGFTMLEGVILKLRPGERSAQDGRYGILQALDAVTGDIVWENRQRAPQTTAALATAGGLVFAGAIDRWLTAYDDRTGEPVWRAQLNDIPNSAPISYAVDGKQYVALVTGYGAPVITSLPGLTPEIAMPRTNSSSIFVFALP
jgi:alcohol dehydrogenase (cytochrome c)